MSRIEWIALLALVTLISPLVGYLLFKVRAKYIHYIPIEIPPRESLDSMEEQYGCVSLLVTVLGIISYAIAVISFVALLFLVVAFVIIPSLPTIISVVAIIFGLIVVFSAGFFVILAILSFLKDLLNPPR